MRLFKRFWLPRHKALKWRSPLFQGGALRGERTARFPGIFSAAALSRAARRSDSEVLDHLSSDSKNIKIPVFQAFLSIEALCGTRTHGPLLTILRRRREARAREGHRGRESAADPTGLTWSRDPRADGGGLAEVRIPFARVAYFSDNTCAIALTRALTPPAAVVSSVSRPEQP